MQLALVTYTHNDAELARALLASIARWSFLPSKVLVIDDASKVPFEAEESKNSPHALVLRPPSHLGPAGAKAFGIEEAFARGADIVLSIDCDVRLHPAWLQNALPLLGSKGVALVGAELAHGLAGDSLSRYLRAFEEKNEQNRQVSFLGAGVWLLRRDTWQQVGGLAGHTETTHEDLYFCRKLADAGLVMIAANELPATQVRRIRYTAFFLRELHYLGFAVLKMCEKKGPREALAPVAQKSALRVQQALASNDPTLMCLELIWVSGLLFWLAGEGKGEYAEKDTREELLSLVGTFLAAAPALRLFLENSLKKMNLLAENEFLNQNHALLKNDFLNTAGQLLNIFSQPLQNKDFLARLQNETLPALEKENEMFDFSFHYIENKAQSQS